MTITWYGENCFKVQNGDVSLLTDPFGSDVGLSAPRGKTDIILQTLASFPREEKKNEETFRINSAGEYEIKGFSVTGIGVPKESAPNFLKNVYLVRADGITLAFLGFLSGTPEATIKERLELEGVDVLFFPVGGTKESPFLSAENTFDLIKDLEPKICVPSLYSVPGLKRKARPLDEFWNERKAGKNEVHESGDKLTIKKKDLADLKQTKFFVINI